jgi:hypothetical protein
MIKDNDFPALAIEKVNELKALVTLHDMMEDMGIANVGIQSEQKYDDNNYYTEYSFVNYQFDGSHEQTDKVSLSAFAEGVKKHLFANFELQEDDVRVQDLLDNAMEWEFDYQFDDVAQAHVIYDVFFGNTTLVTKQDVMREIEARIENYIPVVRRFFCDLDDVAA